MVAVSGRGVLGGCDSGTNLRLEFCKRTDRGRRIVSRSQTLILCCKSCTSVKPSVKQCVTPRDLAHSQDRRIYDLSAPLGPETVSWGSPDGLGQIRELVISQREGDFATASVIKQIWAHVATHADAPGHFVLARSAFSWDINLL